MEEVLQSVSPPSLQMEDNSLEDNEYKLPKKSSLVVIILANILLQISFFIIVSSSNAYSEYLGGTSTFSGLVIGIPTVFSALILLPMMRFDQGGYRRPLFFSCLASILGFILYGLAYKANFLYLILIGRIVAGFSFTMWMYAKRYCSDGRLVGIRRRTTLAGWLVVGQGLGLTAGPFLGGLLYKIGFANPVFNGFTSPAWIMAVVWVAFTISAAVVYQDPPPKQPPPSTDASALPAMMELQDVSGTSVSTAIAGSQTAENSLSHRSGMQSGQSSQVALLRHLPGTLRLGELGVTLCMCWHAMTCFFILGGWESNLPVYGAASKLGWSPYTAGNFIALGGIATFPFLFLNLYFARMLQDRIILLTGSSVGLLGLVLMIALLETDKVTYGGLYACWFFVALGFNISSTVTLSLLSKQLPDKWNGTTSLLIQYSNYLGRVTGAVWGGSGVKVGMVNYVGLQIAIVGCGGIMSLFLWKNLKAKTG